MPNETNADRSGRRRFNRWLAVATVAGLALAVVQVPADATPADLAATVEEPDKAPRSFDEVTLAAEKAEESGQRQELESARGTNSTTFLEPDGSSTWRSPSLLLGSTKMGSSWTSTPA